MTKEKEIILKTIDQDISLCLAWASHHQAMAITGVAKEAKKFHGTKGPEFTDKEKIKDAMLTAGVHLSIAYKLIDQKKSLLSGGING